MASSSSSSSPSPRLVVVVMAIAQGIYHDPLVLPVAAGCLATQFILTLLFSSSLMPDGPWKSTAVFSAKQAVVVVMMLLQTYFGCVHWFQRSSAANNDGGGGPLISMTRAHEGGIIMGRLVLGGLLQDIPTGFMAGAAVDTLMHVHHAGMFLVATICMGYWSNGIPIASGFAPFFFGVIELSSIPLTLVDLFHPKKQPAWHRYHLDKPILKALNEGCRYLFALLYIVLRMIYFPYVTFAQVIPSGMAELRALSSQAAGGDDDDGQDVRVPVIFIMVFNVLFTMMQMYWGTLIIKQIQKALKCGSSSSSSGGTNEGGSGKAKPKIKAV